MGQAGGSAGLEDFDPSGLVRFSTPTEAEDLRQSFINFVWPGGLPTNTLPAVTMDVGSPALFGGNLSGVDQTLVATVDKLDADVLGFDFHSILYLLHPAAPAPRPRLAIVHQGHQGGLTDGLVPTIDHLLDSGFSVIAMQMPLVGWNTDSDGFDGATPFHFGTRGTTGHDEMFAELADSGPMLGGQVFAFFIEPVVQGINHFVAANPTYRDILMIGLSGGGTTAHLAAAADARIDISIPVAGALPLYARPGSGGSGDAEQRYTPLFREVDTDGDSVPDTAAGVASWLEIFALGGIGNGRKQIQVLNFFDACCFYGDLFETYDDFLSAHVDSLGHGTWELVSDTTHMLHQISPFTIASVLDPCISVPETWFLRGECNDDDSVDVSDAVCALNWQFQEGSTPGCIAALNTNGDDATDLSDAVYLLTFLFNGGAPPLAPFPSCGPGLLNADRDIGCESAPEFCR